MSDARGRIVLVTSSLHGGGAETAARMMARWWADRGRAVEIVTLRADEAEGPASEIFAVHHLRLIEERTVAVAPANVARLWRLRRALQARRPAAIIGFLDKLNTAVLLSLMGTRIPVVATEHLVPWLNPLGPVWMGLRRLAYRRAAAVVCPTKEIESWLSTRGAGRFVTLPTPAIKRATPMERSRARIVLAVGRLVPVKGWDRLLRVFAQVAMDFPDWRLEFVGGGPERSRLEAQMVALGLSGRVRFAGRVPDTAEHYARAEVFALSSHHEAFPLVLVEAMQAGLAIVAMDCPVGPRAIVQDRESGLLVNPPDEDRMAAVLREVLGDAELRRRLSAGARRRARELDVEAVMPRWDALLQEVAS